MCLDCGGAEGRKGPMGANIKRDLTVVSLYANSIRNCCDNVCIGADRWISFGSLQIKSVRYEFIVCC